MSFFILHYLVALSCCRLLSSCLCLCAQFVLNCVTHAVDTFHYVSVLCMCSAICCLQCVCQVSTKKCPAWTLTFSQVPTLSRAIRSRPKFGLTAICSLTALACTRSHLIRASYTSGSVGMSLMRSFNLLILCLSLQIHTDCPTILSFPIALLIFGVNACVGQKLKNATLCLCQYQMSMV